MKMCNASWMRVFAAGSTLATASMLTGAFAMPAHAMGAAGAPAYGYAMQGPGWDAPPPELDEVTRRGFHDGIEGARKDYENHRRPDVNNRDEFRHPPVRERDREAYRHGFERGYRVGVQHFYNGR
ncbi:hypothetical protein ACFPT7_13070 [Acidicapsa dinghuensis]|uniref:Uncharacterized protein n=1 Tax=Acidicapsa dinghuensis TaxID=2218256 RepID=A0ABW1EGX4_9BACT|nr:hypothetical protein [Acidicapsa dinghuensis]